MPAVYVVYTALHDICSSGTSGPAAAYTLQASRPSTTGSGLEIRLSGLRSALLLLTAAGQIKLIQFLIPITNSLGLKTYFSRGEPVSHGQFRSF
jgi:hypothetical protein